MARRRSPDGPLAAVLVAPTFVLLALVVGFPLVMSLWQSLFARNDSIDPETGMVEGGFGFVGLDHYTAVVTDPAVRAAFGNALFNTTFFTVVGVAAEVVIGVAMALAMAKVLRGRGLVRAGILVPWAIPTIVSGLLWSVMFQADSGIVNHLLSPFIDGPILWTVDEWPARFAVLIADVWKTAPYIGLLTLAGLLIIDEEIYEAARVDGAGPWTLFWHITLPLVRPVLLVAILFRTLDAMRMFDLPFALFGTNPEGHTLSVLSYLEASQNRYGEAAAYSLYLFAYICLVVLLFTRVLGTDVLGDADERARRRGARRSARRGRAGAGPRDGAGTGSGAPSPALVTATGREPR